LTRRDLFHADRPDVCEACRAMRLHTFAELCEHHPLGTQLDATSAASAITTAAVDDDGSGGDGSARRNHQSET